MAQWKNKVVIVTGGAQGIGRAISLAFAQEGAEVLCADIDGIAGKQLAACQHRPFGNCKISGF